MLAKASGDSFVPEIYHILVAPWQMSFCAGSAIITDRVSPFSHGSLGIGVLVGLGLEVEVLGGLRPPC